MPNAALLQQVICPPVHLNVTMYRDHIDLNTSKIILLLVSLGYTTSIFWPDFQHKKALCLWNMAR